MDNILSALFGKGFDFNKEGLMGILGSEGFANLLKGGTSLYNGMKMGDMLDFQKNLAQKAEGRTNRLFQNDMEDRDALKNIQF